MTLWFVERMRVACLIETKRGDPFVHDPGTLPRR